MYTKNDVKQILRITQPVVYNPDFLAYSLSPKEQSMSKSQGCTPSKSISKKFFIFSPILPYVATQNDLKQILSKTQPVNGYNPDFLAYNLPSHDQLCPKSQSCTPSQGRIQGGFKGFHGTPLLG